MILEKKVVVVMPAYNAGKTLESTVAEIDRTVVDEIVLVDDNSRDNTIAVANRLNLKVIAHEKNLGYGGNQKTCYRAALELGADIVIMVHPDYQYTPRLIPAMASVIACGEFDISLGSRILGGGALKGGMPPHKYIANRLLTLAQNLMTGMKLSEFHTGYRGFTSHVLKTLPLHLNGDDFIFDNQMLIQAHYAGFRIAEITCPTKYFDDASSISLQRSAKYGLLCLWNSVLYLLARLKVYEAPIFRFRAEKAGPSEGVPWNRPS
jgi:glycosyltransferase involved in cell wall biosynthesis